MVYNKCTSSFSLLGVINAEEGVFYDPKNAVNTRYMYIFTGIKLKYFFSCHVGSIAEEIKGSEKMKNTSAVFNPMGKLIGKYTKVLNWKIN